MNIKLSIPSWLYILLQVKHLKDMHDITFSNKLPK